MDFDDVAAMKITETKTLAYSQHEQFGYQKLLRLKRKKLTVVFEYLIITEKYALIDQSLKIWLNLRHFLNFTPKIYDSDLKTDLLLKLHLDQLGY